MHGQQNYSEGHSAYEWYTYHFVGVDQMTGKSLYDLDPEKEATASAAGDLVEINGTKYTTSTSQAIRKWAVQLSLLSMDHLGLTFVGRI